MFRLNSALIVCLAVLCSFVKVQSIVIDACTTPCKCYYRSGEYYVDCKDSDLTDFPSAIPSKVQRLYLQGNSINDVGITNHLGYFPDLEIIFLHNNRDLANVTADAFLQVPKLKMLLLHYTAISHLPEGIFRNNTQLEYIWIFNSNLRTIGRNVFHNLTSLRELKLDYNLLTPDSLPGGVFKDLNSLRKLKVDGNADLPHLDCCQMCGVPPDAFLAMDPRPSNYSSLPCECSGAQTCVDADGGSFALNDCYPQTDAICPLYQFSAASRSVSLLGLRVGSFFMQYAAVAVAVVGAAWVSQL